VQRVRGLELRAIGVEGRDAPRAGFAGFEAHGHHAHPTSLDPAVAIIRVPDVLGLLPAAFFPLRRSPGMRLANSLGPRGDRTRAGHGRGALGDALVRPRRVAELREEHLLPVVAESGEA